MVGGTGTAVFGDGTAATGVRPEVDSANASPSTDGLDIFSEVGMRGYGYGQMH